MQLVEIPSLLELNVKDFADATTGLQRRDESESPQPVILRQSAEPFFLAWLEPPFALELAQLANALRWIVRQVFAFQSPVEERFEPTETSVRRHGAAAGLPCMCGPSRR